MNGIFKRFESCHFVYATHSHFLISDLQGQNSAILGLKRNENITSELFDLNTYGWSAEDVLYNIFNVKSARNFYVGQDLITLLGLISNNSKDKIKIEDLINKLRELELNEVDPLNDIINEASVYVRTL